MISANILYETINYGWALISACMIVFLLSFLVGRVRREGWRGLVFNRPEPEQFAVAILIADGGNMLDRLGRGAWRSIGGDLDTVSGFILLAILGGSAMGMLGVLCKLRVVSIARYGHWPWITSAVLLAVFFTIWLSAEVLA